MVAVVVAVVVLTAEGVDEVAAHGQVESPNLRVKKSHSTDVGEYLLFHFPRVGSWVCMFWFRAIYDTCAIIT